MSISAAKAVDQWQATPRHNRRPRTFDVRSRVAATGGYASADSSAEAACAAAFRGLPVRALGGRQTWGSGAGIGGHSAGLSEL